jgi:hypothetical protein
MVFGIMVGPLDLRACFRRMVRVDSIAALQAQWPTQLRAVDGYILKHTQNLVLAVF